MAMRLLLVALALVLAAPFAQAQSTGESPTYGSVSLRAGFTPDPHTSSITAGGSTAVSISGCNGSVADSPDINLTWTGGSSTLYIYSTSDSDTTLLVNLPNGSWVCNDDTMGRDPVIVVRNAPSGLYNIWSGTFGGGTAAADVMISEIDPR